MPNDRDPLKWKNGATARETKTCGTPRFPLAALPEFPLFPRHPGPLPLINKRAESACSAEIRPFPQMDDSDKGTAPVRKADCRPTFLQRDESGSPFNRSARDFPLVSPAVPQGLPFFSSPFWRSLAVYCSFPRSFTFQCQWGINPFCFSRSKRLSIWDR